MNIDIFPLNKDNKRKTISKLVSKFGLPTICKDLAIYFQDSGKGEVYLHFREDFHPKIYIDTNKTSLKSLFRFLKSMGFDKASIGIATCFNFYNKNKVFLELLTNSFIGDFVQVKYLEKSPAAKL